MTTSLLGRRVDEALKIMEENGIQGQVQYTSAPVSNHPENRTERESRVVAVRGNVLIAAFFNTRINMEKKDDG